MLSLTICNRDSFYDPHLKVCKSWLISDLQPDADNPAHHPVVAPDQNIFKVTLRPPGLSTVSKCEARIGLKWEIWNEWITNLRRSVKASLSKFSSLRHLIPNMRLVLWKESTNFSWTLRSFLVRWSSMRASTRHSMKVVLYWLRPSEGSQSFPIHSWFMSPYARVVLQNIVQSWLDNAATSGHQLPKALLPMSMSMFVSGRLAVQDFSLCISWLGKYLLVAGAEGEVNETISWMARRSFSRCSGLLIPEKVP